MEKELIKALNELQKKLPAIKRDTAAYQYKYAPLEVIWEKIGSIVNGAGFVVTSSVKVDGVHTSLIHENGVLDSFFPFSGEVGPQERGKEITYGRRYNLVALLNLQLEDEDDDAQGTQASYKAQEKAGSCPTCGQTMKTSAKGNSYCPGKYNGSCVPKAKLSKPEQEFSDSLSLEQVAFEV